MAESFKQTFRGLPPADEEHRKRSPRREFERMLGPVSRCVPPNARIDAQGFIDLFHWLEFAEAGDVMRARIDPRIRVIACA